MIQPCLGLTVVKELTKQRAFRLKLCAAEQIDTLNAFNQIDCSAYHTYMIEGRFGLSYFVRPTPATFCMRFRDIPDQSAWIREKSNLMSVWPTVGITDGLLSKLLTINSYK